MNAGASIVRRDLIAMKFSGALEAVFNDNARVTRRSWANRSIYVSVVDGRLCITGFSDKDDGDKRPHPLVVHESDYFADDWETTE